MLCWNPEGSLGVEGTSHPFSLHGPAINFSLLPTLDVSVCLASLCVEHMNLRSVTLWGMRCFYYCYFTNKDTMAKGVHSLQMAEPGIQPIAWDLAKFWVCWTPSQVPLLSGWSSNTQLISLVLGPFPNSFLPWVSLPLSTLPLPQ